MKPVPFIPALFGIVLILPFIYTTGTLLDLFMPPRAFWAAPFPILNSYGAIFLALIGGAYWGFVAKKANLVDIIAALIPPFAALVASLTPNPVLGYAVGIAAMLVLDLYFVSRRVAPSWWLSFRIYTGIIAIGALVYAYYA